MEMLKDRKWAYVLLSVFLAVILWLYVRAEKDPVSDARIRNIPVQITGSSVLSSKGLTVAGLSSDRVSTTLQAPASVLSDISRKNITATIDVSRIDEAGEHTLSYNIVLPTNVNTDGVVIQEKEPETITVTVEKLYTSTLPIEFRFEGSVAKGYQAGTPTIDPVNVTISGAVEQVNRVARAVVVLEAKDLKEQYTGDLPIRLLDANGDELKDLEVELSSETAYIVYPIVVVKEIPLTVNVIAGGGATQENISEPLIVPSKITVAGTQEDIDHLTEISLGSIDLSKVVGTSNFTFTIDLDPSLENVTGITEAKVTVTVSGLETRSFEVGNIKLQNIPRGYSAKADTEAKTVYVRGKADELAMIDSSQLRIVADLKEVTGSGTYTIPVRVYLDAGTEVGVIGDYSIVVSVTR
ncbi:MAG: CdaR family protein [Clostridiales bacterium]|nr:CdaR family protein [Clostridiales bacterium]